MYVYIYTHTYIHIWIDIHTYIYIHVHTYVDICVCVCVYKIGLATFEYTVRSNLIKSKFYNEDPTLIIQVAQYNMHQNYLYIKNHIIWKFLIYASSD